MQPLASSCLFFDFLYLEAFEGSDEELMGYQLLLSTLPRITCIPSPLARSYYRYFIMYSYLFIDFTRRSRRRPLFCLPLILQVTTRGSEGHV